MTVHCKYYPAISASCCYNIPSLSLLVFCFSLLLPSGPPCMFELTTSMSSPLCSLSIATRRQSQKGVCLTESCVWRLWMLTAPRSTARSASMTSSLLMCPSLSTTMVRYALSCSSKSACVGLTDLLMFVCLCYRNTISPPVNILLSAYAVCYICFVWPWLQKESLYSIFNIQLLNTSRCLHT